MSDKNQKTEQISEETLMHMGFNIELPQKKTEEEEAAELAELRMNAFHMC